MFTFFVKSFPIPTLPINILPVGFRLTSKVSIIISKFYTDIEKLTLVLKNL